MGPRTLGFAALLATLVAGCVDLDPAAISAPADVRLDAHRLDPLDAELRAYLAQLGFTGRIGSTLEARLGRRIDRPLADLGRLLFFDPITALNDDNACAGCHSPTHGFGDTQPIAIGIDNNGVVGPDRTGPRNQRRSPSIGNAAFYPTLMWNSRFRAHSGDPFDNRAGFGFPADAIRSEVLRRLNENDAYRARFARVFADVRAGAPITFDHFGRAIAEFEFTQVYANAPIDRYARGMANALTQRQKQGAVLFFGRAGCVRCHAVSGAANEMFSDFAEHVAGVPQVAPSFGNVTFDGPGANEDFGLEQVTADPADRYAFRTSPLRNVALQAAFMHNGAFVRLEDAIRYHLDARGQAASYTTALLPPDLQGPPGPIEPVLERLDPLLREPVVLTDDEFAALVDFVRNGLLDPDARPQRLRRLVPERLPSGREGLQFQFE